MGNQSIYKGLKCSTSAYKDPMIKGNQSIYKGLKSVSGNVDVQNDIKKLVYL